MWLATTAVATETTTDAGTTTAEPVSTTTLPPDPFSTLVIIIPVAIVAGIPIVIAIIFCLIGMISCFQNTGEKMERNRVTPIIGDEEAQSDMGETRVRRVHLAPKSGHHRSVAEPVEPAYDNNAYNWEF